MRYEHPPIASLLIEADLVSPSFEHSRAISNRSTLDFTLHCGEQRIVLPGDDDDESAVGDIHRPFFYRYNTFENLTALMSMLSSGVGARF